jgi:hypothetical protein
MARAPIHDHDVSAGTRAGGIGRRPPPLPPEDTQIAPPLDPIPKPEFTQGGSMARFHHIAARVPSGFRCRSLPLIRPLWQGADEAQRLPAPSPGFAVVPCWLFP